MYQHNWATLVILVWLILFIRKERKKCEYQSPTLKLKLRNKKNKTEYGCVNLGSKL